MTKRRRYKKNSFVTFLAITIIGIIIVLGLKYYFNDDKDISNDYNNIENNDKQDGNNKENKTDKDEINESKNNNKQDGNKDESVVKNEFENISNYRVENLNRYQTYKEKNKELDNETIVTYVNIGLDYKFYSYISDADMTMDNLILMNKYYKLSEDYEPDDLETISSEYFINGNSLVRQLRKEAKEQFEKMSKDSIENGTPVYGQSAYRPYSMQKKLYDNMVASAGVEYADNDTARPGHSEHQTGLAIDVSSTKGGNMLNFENTDSFDWMQENAHKYGFILRYQKDKTNITGFMYESWHYRYVGVDVATDIYENYKDLTYEEYYDKYILK